MLKPCFGQMPMRSITARDGDDWVMKRGTEVAASTFNKERETLQHTQESVLES